MTTYTQNPELPVTVVAGEAAIITPVDSQLHILNEVGTHIWELCAEAHTLEAVVADLLGVFEVDEPTARAEAEAFLRDGVARELLLAIE
ncbi:MAG: hypothetical protein ACJAYU_003033 [Bradymonadia bacterium]|jgi:hypothetical protein